MHTVPEILIERAQAEGLGHFFGLPSSGVLLELLEAGRRCGVDFVSSAHEWSGAISAAYYGYFKGCAGLAIGIQGPGAGNMASGAVNAQYERNPVVCVCECPAAGDYGNWGQQGDHRAMFKSGVRARWRIDEENTAQAAYEAFRQAGQLRLGPVLLELPRNLGQSEGNATWTPVADVPPTDLDPRALDALVEMVASFRRPVIIAGDDVRRAGLIPQLAALAAVLKAAVLVTMDARGVYDETDPRFGCVYIGTQPPHALYSRFARGRWGIDRRRRRADEGGAVGCGRVGGRTGGCGGISRAERRAVAAGRRVFGAGFGAVGGIRQRKGLSRRADCRVATRRAQSLCAAGGGATGGQ